MKASIHVIIFFLLSFFSLEAQLKEKHKTYEEHQYKGLRYGLFKPTDYDAKRSYPVIVYLHGSRDTVSRDLNWYQQTIQSEHPCFVLTPKCDEPNQGWGNTWSREHTAATEKTLGLLDSLIKSYNINTNRLYLYGISMGGFGVFSVLQKNPGKFAAAYAVCGGSDAKAGSEIVSTPLWIFHGAIDDVVPVYLSRDVYKEMVSKGGKVVRYTEYPGVKHNSWEIVSREKTLSKWLFMQERGRETGAPDAVQNFSPNTPNGTGTGLSWSKPQSPANPDKKVWYYKLFRDNQLIAEIDGDSVSYMDAEAKNGNGHSYSIVAVNYFFKESKSSVLTKADSR